MVMTIGIISIKGGVGKTTIAASLATDLANNYRKRVLLVDANYGAPNLGLHMDIVKPDKTIHDVLEGKSHIKNAIHSRFGVHVIPGSYIFDKKLNLLKLKDKISQIKKNYDFVIVDSSPSLNEEILSTMLASDNLFIVTTPDYPTLSCSLKAAKLARQRGRPVSGIIINKIRDPEFELGLKEIEESVGIPVISRIPDDKMNIRALFTRIPTSLYKRNSGFSREISKLGAALTNSREEKSVWKKLFSRNMEKDEMNRHFLKESFYSRVFSD